MHIYACKKFLVAIDTMVFISRYFYLIACIREAFLSNPSLVVLQASQVL